MPMTGRRSFGQITRLPSKRYRARFTGPDGRLYNAPTTYLTKLDAEAWLTDQRRAISGGTWAPPRTERPPTPETLAGFAERWLELRDLKPSTRGHYRKLLDHHILSSLGDAPLTGIDAEAVREWYAKLDRTKPTQRAHCYGLLRAILTTAVTDEKIALNPCHIRSAGVAKRARPVKPATLPELELIALNLPERYRPMLLLSSWCALRFGEVTELRRGDIDLEAGVIRVRRGVVRTHDGRVVGTPKSAAGVRDVAIPPHLIPVLRRHLDGLPKSSRDTLLFPAADGSSHLAPSTLYRVFYPARKAAGRPDLRWHDLRHTGAVLAAQTGATLAELMARLGHATPAAALRYQHVAAGRDGAIAAAMSRIAAGNLTALHAPPDDEIRSGCVNGHRRANQ